MEIKGLNDFRRYVSERHEALALLAAARAGGLQKLTLSDLEGVAEALALETLKLRLNGSAWTPDELHEMTDLALAAVRARESEANDDD